MKNEPYLKSVMLASDIPINVPFPLMCSFKRDGVRASVQRATFYARSLKPIRNKFIQQFANPLYNDLDGELCVGKVNEEATFRRSSSGIMSANGEPMFSFGVFDCLNMDAPFKERYAALEHWFDASTLPPWLQLIPHRMIHNATELSDMVSEALELGYEGLVARNPHAKYKHGRATKVGQQLMRMVPWKTNEATVYGFVEGRHNTNSATKNELGKTNRSTNAENMIPSGKLGAFLVRDIEHGFEFKVGTFKGMTHEFCKYVWENQDEFLNKILKYKHKAVGGYDKPRQPIFMGWRDKIDLGGE